MGSLKNRQAVSQALNPVRLLVVYAPSCLKSVIYKHPGIYEVFKMKSCENFLGEWEEDDVSVEFYRKDDGLWEIYGLLRSLKIAAVETFNHISQP